MPAHRSVLRRTIERRASVRCFAVLPLLGLLTLVGVTVEGKLPYSSYSVTTIRRTTIDSKETANGLCNSNGVLQPISQSELTQMRPLIPPATRTNTRTDDFAPTPNPTPSAAAITTQPSDNAVTEGGTATFSVTATGTAPLSYQWAKNGATVAGATSASYTTPATTTVDNGALFAVTVSNSVSSVISRSASLTVNPLIQGTLEQYGTSSTGVALRWNAFAPPGGGQHPAVLVLHPGGYRTGNAGPDSVSLDLAAAGYLALSTEYRLAPPHTPMNAPNHLAPSQDTVVPADEGHYPEQTTDVQMAIRAARRDPRCDGRVYGVGGSAGASHALYVTATGTPGDYQFDLVVFLSGVYDLADVAWLTDPCVPGEGCPPKSSQII